MTILNRFRRKYLVASHREMESSARLFVHIPKTAGTSFRKSVEAQFGTSRVIRDYGRQQPATTKALLESLYSSGDVLDLIRVVGAQNAVMVCGHFNVGKYGGMIGLSDTATFLREPLSRVVSHYRHAVRHHDYKDGLLEFARSPAQRNTQSRVLSRLDPALLGIIGLTEEYHASIEIFNNRWKWDLSARLDNVGDEKGGLQVHPDDAEAHEILALNQIDVSLYERAGQVFQNCREFQRLGARHEPRGCLTLADAEKGIAGWAFNLDSDLPAQVELHVDGKSMRSIRPMDFRPALAGWAVPRKGHIGFSASGLTLADGQILELRDARHGLILDRKTIRHAHPS